MKKVYPNCYDVIPVPIEEGYIVFRCDKCEEKWLYDAKYIKQEEAKCPYCGNLDTLSHYYKYAYKDLFHYYHMISIKNLLSLINIEIDIIEKQSEDIRLRYQVRFVNVKEPNENEMKELFTRAYQELKQRLEEKTLEVETKIPIWVKDIVNLNNFTQIITPCCDKTLKVKTDKQNINHCIYCNSDFM